MQEENNNRYGVWEIIKVTITSVSPQSWNKTASKCKDTYLIVMNAISMKNVYLLPINYLNTSDQNTIIEFKYKQRS